MNSSLPPGPSYPPAIQMLGFWTRPLAFLERCRARYGKRFTLKFPLAPSFVMITEPEQIKQVFTAPPDVLRPGEGARVLQPIVGDNSVILLDGGVHMEQRKLMLPAFHGERMERLTGLIENVAESEVGAWNGATELELHPRMQRLTMEIILRAVFGLDPGERLDALRDRLARLAAYGDKPITLLGQPPEWLEPTLNRYGPVAGFLDLRAEIDALLFEQIAERRADPGERDDILSILLEARHEDETPMSQQELRDELLTLLIAGHETTATTLAWAFERLVREPAALGRLVAEIDTGDGDEYLTATIRETLRRRPVLPNNAPRLVAKPIEVGGWNFEPGVCLVPNAYLVHHDPDLYPDPYAFRPERWLDQSPGTYTWIPFGGGRRRCLGASFALLEMGIVLRAVLSAYELRPIAGKPELARRRNITVRPGGGSAVAVGAREARVPVAA